MTWAIESMQLNYGIYNYTIYYKKIPEIYLNIELVT